MPTVPRCATPRPDAVGLKSIAAYRVGLDLDPRRPDPHEVEDAAARWQADLDAGAPPRMADEVLDPLRFLDGCRPGTAGAVPCRLRRRGHRPAPLRPAAAHSVAARDRRHGRSDHAAAQLSLPPARRLSGSGLRPRLRRRRPDHARCRQPRARGARRAVRAGAVRRSPVLHRRLRARRALCRQHGTVPRRSRRASSTVAWPTVRGRRTTPGASPAWCARTTPDAPIAWTARDHSAHCRAARRTPRRARGGAVVAPSTARRATCLRRRGRHDGPGRRRAGRRDRVGDRRHRPRRPCRDGHSGPRLHRTACRARRAAGHRDHRCELGRDG